MSNSESQKEKCQCSSRTPCTDFAHNWWCNEFGGGLSSVAKADDRLKTAELLIEFLETKGKTYLAYTEWPNDEVYMKDLHVYKDYIEARE